MCLKVVVNGKHKNVHIREGEVSLHTVFSFSSCLYVRINFGLGLYFKNKIRLVTEIYVDSFTIETDSHLHEIICGRMTLPFVESLKRGEHTSQLSTLSAWKG